MDQNTDKNVLSEEEQQSPRNRQLVASADLIAALESAAQLRVNRQHKIRTRELDAEADRCKTIVNQFLSRHAHDALAAMEFMFMVVPSQLSQLAQIFASHQFTYMPIVNTLNEIAYARKAAAAESKQGGTDGTEKLGG